MIAHRIAVRAHEAIKGSRFVGFDNGGHGLLPVADEVRRNVKEFLEQSLGEPEKGHREP